MRRLLATKQRALEYFVSRALQELKGQLVKIFLFGSLARGDFDKASDIDLLVIYSGDKDDFLGKLDEIAFDTAVQHGELLEAIPMSIHEFRARESSSFLLREVKGGRVLYAMPKEEALKLEAGDYLELAKEFVTYAKGALRRREYRSAVDQAYNGLELAMKALILLRSERLARSHGGIVQQFGRLYVKDGPLKREIGRSVGRALRLRGMARYDPRAQITSEDAKAVFKTAQELLSFLEKEYEKI
jgi:uncharacterized protein (UPF0332 family)